MNYEMPLALRMFPAQAGMNRPVKRCPCGNVNVPRAGGDEPDQAAGEKHK